MCKTFMHSRMSHTRTLGSKNQTKYAASYSVRDSTQTFIQRVCPSEFSTPNPLFNPLIHRLVSSPSLLIPLIRLPASPPQIVIPCLVIMVSST